jgi:hypothetical protein
VKFLKGDISKTLKNPPVRKIALARIDLDSYQSYLDALALLYPLISDGGCIILDDWHLPSCRAAVETFRRNYGIHERVRRWFEGKKVDAHLFVKKG